MSPISTTGAITGVSTIEACGLKIFYNPSEYGEPHFTNFSASHPTYPGGALSFGGPMPESRVHISCSPKNKNPVSNLDKLMNDITYILSIQSSDVELVDNPSIYSIFSKETLEKIDPLYSTKNRGYRKGSDTVGFEFNDWLYQISFKFAEEIQSTNDFFVELEVD